MSDVISKELIQELNIGQDFKIVKLAGNANDNYLIQTADRKVVIKCLGEHTPENEELEGQYRKYLADNKLPVTPFLTFKNGQYVFSNAGHDYVALDYVEGVEARGKESAIVEQIAVLMAEVHILSYDTMPVRVNMLDGTYLELVCNEVQLEGALIEKLERHNSSFIDFWGAGLPEGIIHGDLHAGNIIVDSNDRVVSIVDWEEAGIVPLVLDIAGTVQALSQEENGFNQKVFNRFFKAYQSVRILTQAEKDVFDESLRYRSFIVYIWALMKYTQGLMSEERLIFFKQRYYKHPKVPKIQ